MRPLLNSELGYDKLKPDEIRTDNTDTFKNALKKIVELTEENEQLKAQIEKMKCCGNCGNKRCKSKYRGNSVYHTQIDGFACAENEDWVMRIKEND